MKSELESLIHNSKLGEEEKDLWKLFIENATDEQIETILDALRENMGDLLFLTENLKAKISAFRSKDEGALEKILKEEEKYLSNQKE